MSAMKKNAIWVDYSTVNPSFSRKSLLMAKECGIRFMDAPVSGTKPNAENADLAFFVGAEKNDLDVVKSLLEHMGAKSYACGRTRQRDGIKNVGKFAVSPIHDNAFGKYTALAKEIYAAAKQDGLGRKYFSAIYQFMKN